MTAPAETQTSVTASSLFYPFADRFVPADRALTAGTELPCSGQKVQTKPLASTLLAVAFWGMRETGAAALEPFERKRLFMRQQRIRVNRLAPGPSGAVGIEDGLLAVVVNDRDGNAIDDLVWRWLERDSVDPHKAVVEKVVHALAGGGYYRIVDAERGRIAGAVLGKTKLAPVCERITGLAGAFEQVAAAWHAFQEREPDVHRQLRESCERGIGSRREQSE